MDNYIDFKRQYVGAITRLLNEPVGTDPVIGTPESRRIISQIADLEEAHPDWYERVEGWLAEQELLQGE